MTVRTEQELEEDPDLMYSVEGVEDIRKSYFNDALISSRELSVCADSFFFMVDFQIAIEAVTPARQKSLRVEPRFRLLLKLLSFTKTECKEC